MQVIMAIFLNTGRGTLAVAREVAFAATLLAPVVGTYRFMVGQEMDEQSLMQLNPAFVSVRSLDLHYFHPLSSTPTNKALMEV